MREFLAGVIIFLIVVALSHPEDFGAFAAKVHAGYIAERGR